MEVVRHFLFYQDLQVFLNLSSIVRWDGHIPVNWPIKPLSAKDSAFGLEEEGAIRTSRMFIVIFTK
jgi:hypothetical protein